MGDPKIRGGRRGVETLGKIKLVGVQKKPRREEIKRKRKDLFVNEIQLYH